jgi:hypothetical protein
VQRLGAGVEVGVVVLDAGQQQRLRPVVEELGAAVEVGGVVLVPFDDEAGAGAGMEAARQVARHAADEVARIGAALRVDPGRDGRGRRLAMGPRHHQRAAALQEEAGEGLRHGEVGDLPPLHLHRLHVVAADGVADHHQVGPRLEVDRVVAHGRPDAGALEQRAHRRIERAVGAADAMALLLQQTGQRRHPGTTDRQKVNVESRGIHAWAFS